MTKEIRTAKYLGESSRSGYERGFEHLANLATLKSNSHMLRHMIEKHSGKDFSQIKWGMFILEHTRSAFERQIKEAVIIQQKSKGHEILNSRIEWGINSLPRLITRMGEKEMLEWERERKQEIAYEEVIEGKMREFRKERNKGWLNREKAAPPRKRQRVEWG